MHVSEEHMFPHLREAAAERQRRELEYRRIARERATDTTPTAGRGLRKLVQRFRGLAHPAPRPLSHP